MKLAAQINSGYLYAIIAAVLFAEKNLFLIT